VYDPPDASQRHYATLLASETDPPSAERRRVLHQEAKNRAQHFTPESVMAHYVTLIARDPGGLELLEKPDLWEHSRRLAASRIPAPEAAAQLAETTSVSKASASDGYLDKIAKYVPAESVTITTLAFAAFKPTGLLIWIFVAAGAIANVLYLFGTALQARSRFPMPRCYFYALSAIALVLWAMAVINVVSIKAGIKGPNADAQKTFVLAAAAFFVPLLDTIATGLTNRKRQ
jgi:hypothetical protein